MIEFGSPEFWKRLDADPARLAAEICDIDVVNLDDTLQRHSSLRAWVNATHESARIAEERAKFEVTKARARALLKAKEVKDPNTGKDKTVPVIAAEVDVDAEVVRTTEAELVAAEKRGALRAMSSALDDRLQMLVQIAAKQRAELKDNNY